MQKPMLALVTTAAALAGLPASSALAASPARADAPFVCPVLTISGQAPEAGPFKLLGNGEYTLAPGSAGSADTFKGNVPTGATNADGAGSPGGSHSSPGDTDYTAIWSGNG